MLARAIRIGIAALGLVACAHPAANTPKPAELQHAGPAANSTSLEPASPATIRITARQWSFTPEEIHLALGQSVILEIASLDVTHGFNVPDLDVRVDVKPGKPTHIPVQPRRAGTYAFHCDVFCGDGHEQMSGRIVVDAAP
jgi:cytochrome c oxidase subunit 2